MSDDSAELDDLPEPVRRLYAAVELLDGVAEVAVHLQDLAELTPETFATGEEFADLPHALLRRTAGGKPGEQMASVELVFDQSQAGWVACEFLAWWARDRSASLDVQMRPLALSPTGVGTQLGRTLRFVIEELIPAPHDPIAVIGAMADSLVAAVETHAAALAYPTRLAAESLEELRELAELNDAQAMVDLGHALRPDEDAPDAAGDGAESRGWFERAAELGHPEGAVQAGLAYRHGDGVEADDARATGYFRVAAEGGLPLGMALYGQALQQGAGVAADPAAAAVWYEQGGDAGEPACYAQLGDCYENGLGVERDLAKARHFYELAIEEGFDEAEAALARLSGEMS